MEGERYISFAENNTRLNSNLDMILFNQFLKQDLVGDQPHLESGCPIFQNPRLKKKYIYINRTCTILQRPSRKTLFCLQNRLVAYTATAAPLSKVGSFP